MTEDDERDVQTALHCAETGNATHWPTAAGILADEVKRLRGLSADPATIERMAYALARTHFAVTHDGSREWDERVDWKICRLLFEAMARAAVRALQGEA